MPQKRKATKPATKKAGRTQQHARAASTAGGNKKPGKPGPGGAKAAKKAARPKQHARPTSTTRHGRNLIKSAATKAKASSKAQVTKKSAGARRKPQGNRPQIGRRSDIELETEGSELTHEVPAAPGSDFEGLSRVEDVDSESVDELVEEGNVAEYGAVAGVEKADNRDGKEVRTKQLLEDDVPQEYDNMD